MNRWTVAVIAACALGALCGARGASGMDVSSATARGQLKALEQQWTAAEQRHDTVALDRILDDHFICTFGAGKPLDKAAFIRLAAGGAIDPTLTQDLADEVILVDHDTAVISEADTIHGTTGGKAYIHQFRVTATYIRRHGHWLALAEHLAWPTP